MQNTYSEIINGLSYNEGKWVTTIPENWMQGRTTYGGLSSAICLKSILNEHDDLPPIRSAQISFVGPAGGTVETKSSVLRRGKSVAFVESSMQANQSIATHALFCFGAARKSHLNEQFSAAPSCPGVEDSEDFFKLGPGPSFAQNFDCLLAQGGFPMSGSNQHEHYIWIRFKETLKTDPCSMLAIGDMPPPAVMPMLTEFVPISSMNWTVNFVQSEPTTENGWWLMRTCAEHAKNGYSSQDMQIWNTKRELVMTGRQNVAVFY